MALAQDRLSERTFTCSLKTKSNVENTKKRFALA